MAFASTTWKNQVRADDLINTGSAALLGTSTVSTTHNSFQKGGLNNGVASQSGGADNTFFSRTGPICFTATGATGHVGATAQFNLNGGSYGLGYTITSIQSFMGWGTVSAIQANQTYVVSVSLVGSSAFTDIATVSYRPFADGANVSNSNYESHVVLTQDDGTGILASGVDSILFTFLDPLSATTGVVDGAGTTEGTVIRELDVHGFSTVPEPSVALLGGLGVLALLRRRRRN